MEAQPSPLETKTDYLGPVLKDCVQGERRLAPDEHAKAFGIETVAQAIENLGLNVKATTDTGNNDQDDEDDHQLNYCV